jgi:hypothetical protein
MTVTAPWSWATSAGPSGLFQRATVTHGLAWLTLLVVHLQRGLP